ncbi:MAG: VWA domain-containing protein [Blastocatellia bacterium]
MRAIRFILFVSFLVLVGAGTFAASGQSGKGNGPSRRTMTLNVIVHAPEGRTVTREDVDLYDGGLPQEIESFAKLDSGSRIVLMIDSSQSLRAELPALQKAAEAVVNELFADDQMMIVGYNETAEIVQDMTPDLNALQAAAPKVVRKGVPNLYDALIAVSDSLATAAKSGLEKRAIILISDGYDSESKTKFAEALRALQDENIVLYALQVSDRTHGALLRDKPKPTAALEQMTAATGGSIFSFDKSEDAAKSIADDLRKNWYRLVYIPSGVTSFEARRLLLMPHDDKIQLKTKSQHPSKLRPMH